ncbi:MAG: AI-2E family transporter [Candidatus Altiarchaeota archaeon]|nr:AI-2E family transporter [Candidatus Altiarchaeota archaeon]
MIREVLLVGLLLLFARPLLGPLAYAAVLSVALSPLYQMHKKKYFAAFLVVASIGTLVYMSYIMSVTLIDQVNYLLTFYDSLGTETQVQIIELSSNLPIQDYALSVAKAIPSIAIQLLFFVIFTYFFLVDGEKIKKSIYDYLPKQKAEALIKEGWGNLNAVVSGVFMGMFVYIILSTGVLYLTGSPSPLVYSIIAGIFGILPILGAWMVYIFIIAYHFSNANYLAIIALVTFQTVWLLVIDNFFKMKFRGTLHPGILLGSMVSGIAYFGFSGILIGPLLATGLKTLAIVDRHFVEPVHVVESKKR